MFFDPLYFLFALPGLALSLWAQFRVKSTFGRYSQVPAQSGMSGAEAARELIRQRGVQGVRVEETSGTLSDHYDPFHKVLRLSQDVYHGRSLAALGVAAHEAGHALQHANAYGPLKLRSLLVRPASLGSNLGMFLTLIGLAIHFSSLTLLGIILFSAAVLFTVVTRTEKYESKAFVDTVVFRGSDVAAANVCDALGRFSVSAAALAILPLAVVWMALGAWLGREQAARSQLADGKRT